MTIVDGYNSPAAKMHYCVRRFETMRHSASHRIDCRRGKYVVRARSHAAESDPTPWTGATAAATISIPTRRATPSRPTPPRRCRTIRFDEPTPVASGLPTDPVDDVAVRPPGVRRDRSLPPLRSRRGRRNARRVGRTGPHANGPRPAFSRSGTICRTVELRGIEPLTFSMRTRRATNCAIAPCGSVNRAVPL